MSHIVTAYVYSHAREKTDLAFCTSYGDETSADIEQQQQQQQQKNGGGEGLGTNLLIWTFNIPIREETLLVGVLLKWQL